jgi:hypothetical protein
MNMNAKLKTALAWAFLGALFVIGCIFASLAGRLPN